MAINKPGCKYVEYECTNCTTIKVCSTQLQYRNGAML